MEKKQTFSVHTERDVKLTVEDIDDIMVAALEGGINYWGEIEVNFIPMEAQVKPT